MAPRVIRALLVLIAALASASGAAAQDSFGNGEGHSGAFTAPPGYRDPAGAPGTNRERSTRTERLRADGELQAGEANRR